MADNEEQPDKLRAKLDHAIVKNNVYRIERQIFLNFIKEQAGTILQLTQQLNTQKGE